MSSSFNPPGFQPSGVAVNSFTNAVAVASPGQLTRAPASASFNTLAVADKLKIFSVIFGLIAVVLIAYAYNNAYWFVEPEVKSLYCPDLKNPDFRTCYETYFYQDDVCNEVNRRVQVQLPNKKVFYACPSRWLVIPQLYIIAFVWAGTFIFLMVLMCANLSNVLDMIGHLIAGCLTIICGLCLFGYCCSVWYRAECSREGTGGYGPGPRTLEQTFNNTSNTTVAERQFGPGGSRRSDCKEIESLLFKQWHVLFGALFAFVTAALYIVIGVTALKRKGQQVTPM